MTLTNSTFSGNYVSGAYGGSGIYNNGTLTVTSCTFNDNDTAVSGGGIYNGGGNATIDKLHLRRQLGYQRRRHLHRQRDGDYW